MPEQTRAEIDIAASPTEIMRVIADLPAYPDWCYGVGSAVVEDRFPTGRPRLVTMVLDAPPLLETHHYAYEWHEDDEVRWHLTEGGIVSALRGRYLCRETGRGLTRITYDLRMTLNMPLIGALRTRAERHIVGTALRGLKKRVEAAR